MFAVKPDLFLRFVSCLNPGCCQGIFAAGKSRKENGIYIQETRGEASIHSTAMIIIGLDVIKHRSSPAHETFMSLS